MPRMLSIRGAVEHNLKNVNLDLPHNSLVVLCGVSGSGKSSLAFDTVYAEARRRFHAALDPSRSGSRWRRPRVASLEGLAPPIAIAQLGFRADPRSTAGTLSGAYEYFRLLFARTGQPRCLVCGQAVIVHRFEEVYERAAGLPEGTKLTILAPLRIDEVAAAPQWSQQIERAGFARLRLDGEIVRLDEVDSRRIQSSSTIEVVVDRLVVKAAALVRLKGSLEAAVEHSGGRVTLDRLTPNDVESTDMRFSVQPSCSACGAPFEPITPGLFSFNSPRGACPGCRGTGVQSGMEFERFFADKAQALDEALGPLWSEFGHAGLQEDVWLQCQRVGVDPQQPIGEWPPQGADKFWRAGRAPAALRSAPGSADSGRKPSATFPGLRRWLERRAAQAEGNELQWMEERLSDRLCAQCEGSRLSRYPLSVWLEEETIATLMARPVRDTLSFLKGVKFDESRRLIGETIIAQIVSRLQTIEELGLDYLALDRSVDALSSGELQRLRLAAALGGDMTGMLYVLDEPSVGLHARDAQCLAMALLRLRDQGNTLLVVEHDIAVLERADFLVDMGPGAGIEGGHVSAQGTPTEVAATDSPSARYLRGEPHAITGRQRSPGAHGWLRLSGASGHNLKDLDVAIPLQCLVAVSGVSGSGKSSLIHGTLFRLAAARLHKAQQLPLPFRACSGLEQVGSVLAVDQKSIGRSARSNTASYSGLLAYIRRLYAELPEAKLRGYRPAHFSFNVPEGACEQCGGTGLGPERTHGQHEIQGGACASCDGRRFKREVHDIRFRQVTIVEALEMSVIEALDLFGAIPQIERRLQLLRDLGLGYLVLGQPASRLSGGEAQRLKLTAQLSRSVDSQILYILDEPTTGLHIRDVEYLITLLQLLIERGHSVIVVEHDLDVIRCADYVIDMGPESGDGGGQIVVAGAPDEIVAAPGSHTGRCLADRQLRGKQALEPI